MVLNLGAGHRSAAALRQSFVTSLVDQIATALPAGPVQPLVRSFPEIVNAGEVVTFDATASFHREPGRLILGYEWDFDDDGRIDDVGDIVVRIFAQPGEYRVTLRVSDDSYPAYTAQKRIKLTVKP